MALKLTGALNRIPDYTYVSMLRIHLACGFQTRVTAKSRPQKTLITNSSQGRALGFLPINFKLATTTPRRNLCVIRWFWRPSIIVHLWYEMVFSANRHYRYTE